MAVSVHLSSNLRGPTGGLAQVEAKGATVGALIDDLDRRYPGLGDALRAGVSVVIDGLLIAHPEYEPLADGAQVYFVPQTAGGSVGSANWQRSMPVWASWAASSPWA